MHVPERRDLMDDVFGAMLTAALDDRSVLETVERDDGFVNTLPASRYFDAVSALSAVRLTSGT